jgi:hypothetical protein
MSQRQAVRLSYCGDLAPQKIAINYQARFLRVALLMPPVFNSFKLFSNHYFL